MVTLVMLHSAFSNAPQPYAEATYADYRAFLLSWFQAGGTLRLEDCLNDCTPGHILIAPKVRDFEMDQQKNTAQYYLFQNGTYALISRHLNILSVKEPLDFSRPPLVTPKIIRDLQTDIAIKPLTHYFSGDIAECLILTYLLSGADAYNALALTFTDQLMKEFSGPAIQSMIDITREHYHRQAFHTLVQKYNIPQAPQKPEAVFDSIQRSKSLVLSHLSKALQTLETREAAIRKWAPFNPNPERRPVIMSERELAWRISYEWMQNKKYPHLKR